MIWIIIVIVGLAILYNMSKGSKDIKNVEKFGGLENKYGILIKNLMSNEKLRLRKINSNNIEIGYSFVGDGYVYFKLIEIDKKLLARYESKDMVDGVQKLAWKFDEFEDQKKMFQQIAKDLTIHNFMKSGLSKQDALEAFNKISK